MKKRLPLYVVTILLIASCSYPRAKIINEHNSGDHYLIKAPLYFYTYQDGTKAIWFTETSNPDNNPQYATEKGILLEKGTILMLSYFKYDSRRCGCGAKHHYLVTKFIAMNGPFSGQEFDGKRIVNSSLEKSSFAINNNTVFLEKID